MCIPLVHSLYYNFIYIMTHTNSQQMKYFLTAALALVAWCGLSAQKPTTQPLRLEDVVHGAFAPNYIYGVRPAADGETYVLFADHLRPGKRSARFLTAIRRAAQSL